MTPQRGERGARVAAVRVERYPPAADLEPLVRALRRLGAALDWGGDASGAFAAAIPAGAKVLVKPNWVLHANQGGWGLDAVVTHPTLVRAVAEELLRTGAAEVRVGDAPVQGCDFETLLRAGALDDWSATLRAADPRFRGVEDFRRTKARYAHGIREASEDERPLDRFVLFDLAADSLLEPVSGRGAPFRVTQYDPRRMAQAHAPGRHRYLVAREVIEADVLVNLPKLKTHKKAGVTCALKNLIGINGNKEFLPHHRVGGAAAGGDCYPGRSVGKRLLEHAFDRLNMATAPRAKRAWHGAVRVLDRLARRGDAIGIEGAWSGNDTIWRTCLDLNRILLYGRADGTLADVPQRRVLHVVDAVVAGQGDGPLAPQPLERSLLLGGESAAAVDWVGALALGYDPERIPTVREAFGAMRWPLAAFAPPEIVLVGDAGLARGGDGTLAARLAPETDVAYPAGWIDAAAAARPRVAVATATVGGDAASDA